MANQLLAAVVFSLVQLVSTQALHLSRRAFSDAAINYRTCVSFTIGTDFLTQLAESVFDQHFRRFNAETKSDLDYAVADGLTVRRTSQKTVAFWNGITLKFEQEVEVRDQRGRNHTSTVALELEFERVS